MPINHRAKLATIRRFDQLKAYLRDEMGWPIGSEDFEDLTFDYTPEELGIDAKNAAKIQEIKRLRPLSTNQPWGIFFVKFEPKRLPVVALRRILSQVTLKKRASANSAERAAWSADDLLFISNYGEGQERQISLAHFSQNEAKKDLPTLKVLGWDNLDTALHLDHVAELLTEHLAWPDDEEDKEEWRKQWRSAFTLGHREVITTSKKLSVELAGLARNIRNRINTVLAIETEDGPVTKLMAAFKEALVHDLDEDGFADMYAQTIAYGLLSARVANPSGGTADDVAAAMPVTNPFLKELMEIFLDVGGRKGKAGRAGRLDFDELGVSEVVELLDAANMEAVVRDFGDRNPQEDPVIHFYELFLKEYDAKKRMQRGVFYTPRPVVSFIVRSVDELLRTEFGLEDGFADTSTWGEMAERFNDLEVPKGATPDQAFVQILDPATGTGTFLVEVIGLIHKTMTEKWQAEGHGAKKIEQLWNDYVSKNLLPRLHGYELMMAPYAIAHMKIGLKLYETGYCFESDERVRVYLTNSLEPPQDFSGKLAFAIPSLAHEGEAVNAIKRNQYFTVIIGNPPYSARSYNLTAEARELIEVYKYIDGQRIREKGALQLEKNLNDDYVKFLRFAQVTTSAHAVIISMITNHSFLENPTLRGMRWSLLKEFDLIELIDLGGNLARKEKAPDGTKDENVFDIGQGVAISVFLGRSSRISTSKVRVSTLRGSRQHKYSWLIAHTSTSADLDVVQPSPDLYLFRFEDAAIRNEYEQFIRVTDLFPVNSTGVKTHRDKFCIDFDETVLRNRIMELINEKLTDEEVRARYQIPDTYGWSLARCRSRLRQDDAWEQHFSRILYRPFDWRPIYFSTDVIELPRMEVSSNFMSGRNLGLIFMRQVASNDIYNHFGVTRDPADNRAFYSNRGTMSFAPLYLFRDDSNVLFTSEGAKEAVPNLSTESIRRFEVALATAKFSPEDIFHYAYSVFYSSRYRSRYAEFLKVDFPRLPLPGNLELFRSMAEIGAELVSLHLMESSKLDDSITEIIGSGEYRLEKVSYSDETVWINKAKTRGFRGVMEEIWNFHIGGYQVCEKWLKDRQAKGGKNPRPGRVLTDKDINHYQKIVVALSETIRIMEEIDKVIEAHGGWPDAFLVKGKDAESVGMDRRSSEIPRVAEDGSSYENNQN